MRDDLADTIETLFVVLVVLAVAVLPFVGIGWLVYSFMEAMQEAGSNPPS